MTTRDFSDKDDSTELPVVRPGVLAPTNSSKLQEPVFQLHPAVYVTYILLPY